MRGVRCCQGEKWIHTYDYLLRMYLFEQLGLIGIEGNILFHADQGCLLAKNDETILNAVRRLSCCIHNRYVLRTRCNQNGSLNRVAPIPAHRLLERCADYFVTRISCHSADRFPKFSAFFAPLVKPDCSL